MAISSNSMRKPLIFICWSIRQNNSHVKIINMYGITETTVHVTYKEIGDQEIENGISDIGMPIPTLGMYIIMKHRPTIIFVKIKFKFIISK